MSSSCHVTLTTGCGVAKVPGSEASDTVPVVLLVTISSTAKVPPGVPPGPMDAPMATVDWAATTFKRI